MSWPSAWAFIRRSAKTGSYSATRMAISCSAGFLCAPIAITMSASSGRERRGCLRTDVLLQNRALHVFNVHLGTAFFERRQQAKHLIDEAVLKSRTLDGPRVVLGDFNEWSRGHVSQMLASEFESTDIRVYLKRARTYPAIFPVMHLDHIYYDPQLSVEHVALHRTKTSLVASDHVPLVTDFRLE